MIDVGTQKELRGIKKLAGDFDMSEVEKIMNKSPVTDQVIEHWQEKAKGRKTVIFCSTVEHAKDVTQSFNDHNIEAVLVHGGLSDKERKEALESYERGKVNIVVNVAVLTEGWDYQPTSCVILLRPSSYKSTMIQMIGRGLRSVDPELYPNVIKDDCIILDFGTSSLIHGCLEQDGGLGFERKKKFQGQKVCPDCEGIVPAMVKLCEFCGHSFVEEKEEIEEEEFAREQADLLSDFAMSEIDLLAKSNFRWCDLFGDDKSLMACGFNAFAGLFYFDGHWYGIGHVKNRPLRIIAKGSREVCLAKADDFLNMHESNESAYKSKRWLDQVASSKQLAYLPSQYRMDLNLNKYHAMALLNFKFNRQRITNLVFNQQGIA